jgi:hypothetical protein
MNKLWLVVGFTTAMLSSCITTAQYNNAEDDVYYSPKASNKKAPVMIPDVDVDEIIKKNPPQYGTPTNRIDDVTTNPYAAIGYPTYRAEQDSLYRLHPEYSGYYVDPSLTNSEQEEAARRLRRVSSGGNWYTGVGYNSWGWGPTLSIGLGWGTYGRSGYGGYGGYGNYCDPWYSGYGYGSGWGCNSWGGWGSSWGYPYSSYYNNCWPNYGYGYGYYNNPYYGGYYPYYYGNGYYGSNNNNSGGGDNSPSPIERPRPSVGSNNPPATGSNGLTDQNGNMMRTTAPSMNPATSAPAANENPYMTRTTPAAGTAGQPQQAAQPYTPASGSARLDNINGRQVYTPPAPPVQQQPAQPSYGAQQAPVQQQRNTGGQQQQYQQPSYNNPAPSMPSSPPSGGGGRSVGGSGGGGRSSGGGGGGGVQRPR